MTLPFYMGQEDYIDKLNQLSTAAASYDALAITKTGSFAYIPIAARCPTPVMDNLDGTSGTVQGGKSIWQLSYDETLGASFSTAGSTLTAVSFDDLAAVGLVLVQNSPTLQTLQFPALTSYGLSVTSGTFNVLTCPALTSLTFPNLVVGAGAMTLTSLPLVTSLDLGALKTILSVSFSLTTLSTLVLTNLQTVLSRFTLQLHALTTLSLPALVSVGSLGLTLSTSNATLTTISAPNLVTCGTVGVSAGYSALTALSFPALKRVVTINVSGTCAALATISLPSIVEFAPAGASALVTSTCANLVTVTLGSTLKICGGNVTLTGAKLNQASVDNILARLAALDGTGGTTAFSSPMAVNLSGGTSSTPSAAGLVSKATLVARGVTVTHN